MSFATVNPALVLGPVLSPHKFGLCSDRPAVDERLACRVCRGSGFNLVDVRDVADLHIRAMTAPEAAGRALHRGW